MEYCEIFWNNISLWLPFYTVYFGYKFDHAYQDDDEEEEEEKEIIW